MQGTVSASRLRVYTGERARWRGEPLAHALVRLARERGLAGATIVRGVAGYGAHHRVHEERPFTLSDDLPLVVEVVDLPDRVQAFVEVVAPMLPEGLLTVAPVQAVFFGAGRPTG